MTATLRSLFARTYMKAALAIAPIIFVGAECDPAGPGVEPLAMDAMRAEVTTEGSFFSNAVIAKDMQTFWTITANGGGVNDKRTIELDIPKPAGRTVPYTIDVTADNQAVIFYCIPITPGSQTCKNFFADQAHGGSGTITITNTVGHLAGTFNGNVKVSNGTETRTISGGEFKADL
jgi:hypothetical protein